MLMLSKFMSEKTPSKIEIKKGKKINKKTPLLIFS